MGGFRSWSKPRSPSGAVYVHVRVHDVVVGGHYGSGHTDNAGSCSHAEFLAGRYQDVVLEDLGQEVLDEVLAELATRPESG